MPYFGGKEWRDTKRWLACQAAAAKAMITEGWNKHAKKFRTVQLRRAVQLYRSR